VENPTYGTPDHSPQEAHQNELYIKLKKQDAELLGFFSTEHKGVFTHHDSNVHIHVITADRKKMGHLESMAIKKGTARLYIAGE